MLKYISNGDFIPGVPARDLIEQEIPDLPYERGLLIKSGLYIEVKAEIAVHADKAEHRTRENKVIGGNNARG